MSTNLTNEARESKGLSLREVDEAMEPRTRFVSHRFHASSSRFAVPGLQFQACISGFAGRPRTLFQELSHAQELVPAPANQLVGLVAPQVLELLHERVMH